MNRRHLLALFATAALAQGAFAQGVYKSVGPDGRVVYSDRPPAGDGAKVDVLRAPTNAPAPAAKPAQPTPGEATAGEPSGSKAQALRERLGVKSAKQALPAAATAAPEAQAATTTPDPTLEQAVTSALGLEQLVGGTEDLCLQTLPTSMKRYSGAATEWRSRNAGAVQQTHRVLASLPPARRVIVEGGVRAKTEQMLGMVKAAPAASRIKWCDNSVGEMNAGAVDIKPAVVAALNAARPR